MYLWHCVFPSHKRSFFLLVRLNSKWDLRRLCKTVGAVALPKMVSVHLCLSDQAFERAVHF